MKKWKEFSEKVKMCYEQSCEDAAIFDDVWESLVESEIICVRIF